MGIYKLISGSDGATTYSGDVMSRLDKVVCNALREAREAAGLTQVEAAKKVGTNQANISAFESGFRVPGGIKLLYKFAKAYGTTVSELLKDYK